jgi:YbgC/YbaW family acyl-CoA thioester hydrolase
MTDQPPPPSDKKPRRRSAPRKRSPARRATKAETANAAVEKSIGSGDVSSQGDTGVSSPDALAERLDPTPLADAGNRGDAPASDSPLVDTAPSVARGRRDHARRTRQTAAQPDEAAGQAVASHLPEAEKPELTDATQAPAADKAPAPATAMSFPRQAELRPGELIRVPLSVRWRDLDAFNHVNNSKYLSYLEEARLRWMLAMPGMGMDDNVAPVVAASNLNYRRPIEWPGDVVIELFVERIGGSSLTIGHRIVDSKDGGTLYCDGNVVMVWIDRNSGRSAPLPESVRAACR